ncbi:pyridoxamine 5'-phosphate oxidase [Phytoactinopolyspora mesophila]|uniref:Pyridoxamine 5'-phosphate oxidase n=1 Tax=Phytoactinopolyspora mesophila TaxID=2650750 RepID=A0A7K3M200_9ACTN|nr:pyridoxamine 5'-phosphate oxidase [Phytoactinopolyspora mesophila]NDL57270.1 pyridoxamine 5'-phosphate oxidase [Phytoactinopolyspora mesophila]
MSFVMTSAERESFLSGIHVGVLAVERDGRAPLAVPIWYDYEPGGDVLLWMHRDSIKDQLISKAGRLTLVAQTEQAPYKYVSVEGPVVSNGEAPTRQQALAITRRYLPDDEAVAYVDGSLGEVSILVRMRPEKWLSNDQSK